MNRPEAARPGTRGASRQIKEPPSEGARPRRKLPLRAKRREPSPYRSIEGPSPRRTGPSIPWLKLTALGGRAKAERPRHSDHRGRERRTSDRRRGENSHHRRTHLQQEKIEVSVRGPSLHSRIQATVTPAAANGGVPSQGDLDTRQFLKFQSPRQKAGPNGAKFGVVALAQNPKSKLS